MSATMPSCKRPRTFIDAVGKRLGIFIERAQRLVKNAIQNAARALLVAGLVTHDVKAGHDIRRPAHVMKVTNGLPHFLGRRGNLDFLERASHGGLPIEYAQYRPTRHLLG